MTNKSKWLQRLRFLETDTFTNENVKDIPSDWMEEFEERAAILEYDGGLSREEANAQAMAEIKDRMRETS